MPWYLDSIDPRLAPSDAGDPSLFVPGVGPNFGKQMTAVSWDNYNQYFGYACPGIWSQMNLIIAANQADAYTGDLFP